MNGEVCALCRRQTVDKFYRFANLRQQARLLLFECELLTKIWINENKYKMASCLTIIGNRRIVIIIVYSVKCQKQVNSRKMIVKRWFVTYINPTWDLTKFPRIKTTKIFVVNCFGQSHCTAYIQYSNAMPPNSKFK